MKPQSQKQKNLFMGLIIGAIISILLGIFLMAILSKSNKELVTEAINTFMEQVKKGDLAYQQAFIQSLLKNSGECILFFLLGMSIIGFPITLLLFFTHAFTLGFSISSIFYVYKWKGILLAFVYVLPQLLNLCILLIFCYFSLLLSKYLFYHLILKKEFSFKRMMTRYMKNFAISLGLLIASSILEVFVIPKIMNFLL